MPLITVTTQWGEWRRQHPDSQVTADNPEQQSYLEGQVNYREFVAEDRLVGNQTTADLAADTEILGLTHGGQALAIPLPYLREHRIFRVQLSDAAITVLTSNRGAIRAYLTGETRITQWLDADKVADSNGQVWMLGEHELSNNAGQENPRLPARQAQWAAWQGAYENTRVAGK